MGSADLVDCLGPLSYQQLIDNVSQHRVPAEDIPHIAYKNTFAWILNNAKRFEKPIPYKHPSGAVIWVKLDDLKVPEKYL